MKLLQKLDEIKYYNQLAPEFIIKIHHEDFNELSAAFLEAVELLKKVTHSESLKEAPFYGYCQSVANSKELLKKIGSTNE